jgi:hypothetical protein
VLSAIPIGSPQFPGSNTASAQALQLLFVLERVHARPETVEFVADQLFFFDQSVKRSVYNISTGIVL